MKDVSDVLMVTFDSGSKDEAALCVARRCGEEIVVLKTEVGVQADLLYHFLTEPTAKIEIPVTSKQETVTEFTDKCRECGSILGRNTKQKTGRWLSHKEYCEKHDLIPSDLVIFEWCSNCDFGIDINELHWGRYKYCPNCGAKMEE